MIRFSPTKLPYCLAMLLLPAAAAAANGQDEEKTPAMKIREVLQQPITLDYSASNLKDLAKHLSDKTGVKFFVDVKVQGLPCLDPSCSFELKADRVSLSGVLRRCLAQQKLTYVVLEDSVALASESSALNLQLGQIVSVHCENVPLLQALKNLARTTPFNLVIDPRADIHPNKNEVTIDLENTTLESAVSLMAEMTGYKAVVVDNAIFVTYEDHAARMNDLKAFPRSLRSGDGVPGAIYGPISGPFGPPPMGGPTSGPPMGGPPVFGPPGWGGPPPGFGGPPVGLPPGFGDVVQPAGPAAAPPGAAPAGPAAAPQQESESSPTPTCLIEWKPERGTFKIAYWDQRARRAADASSQDTPSPTWMIQWKPETGEISFGHWAAKVRPAADAPPQGFGPMSPGAFAPPALGGLSWKFATGINIGYQDGNLKFGTGVNFAWQNMHGSSTSSAAPAVPEPTGLEEALPPGPANRGRGPLTVPD